MTSKPLNRRTIDSNAQYGIQQTVNSITINMVVINGSTDQHGREQCLAIA